MGELNLIGEEFIFGALSTRRALRDCVNAIFKAKGDRKVLREILKSNKSDFDKMVELMDTFKGV